MPKYVCFREEDWTRALEVFNKYAATGEVRVLDEDAPVPDPDPVPPETEDKVWMCYWEQLSRETRTTLLEIGRNRGWPQSVVAEWHYKNYGKNEGKTWGCPEESGSEKRFHHYNASAWHDKGVAVILCPGDKASAASIGGKALRRHGNLDKGREVWADYRTRGLTGTLRLVIGGVVYTAEITNGDGVTEGDCWRAG